MPTSPILTPTPILSPQAAAYLTVALDIMQQHSVNREKIDWAVLRQEAFAEANHAKTPADTYSAIKLALQHLGDHHSRFYDPQAASQLRTEESTSNLEPSAWRLPHDIGYLEILPFEGTNPAARQRYIQHTQDAIQRVDQTGTCGWIVDLRTNTGGSMWPMLAGVGPILGEGIAGSFVFPDGTRQLWSYYDGQAQLDGSILARAMSVYHLKHPSPPVAVLTGPLTMSSGEAIAVAFRGRPHTRSFGGYTYGVPTANAGYPLSDGALLILTEAVDADRTGQTYTSAIAPDELVPGGMFQNGTLSDRAVQFALTWLHEQEGC